MTHPKPEILALLASGDLAGTDARAADEHVAGCEACRGELAEIRKSVAEFRGWAADGEPPVEEIQELHEAVMAQMPRTQRGWIRGWAAAVAAVVICASALIWGPWRVHRQDYRQASAVVDGEKSHGDTSSQGSANRGQRSRKIIAAVRTSNRSVVPGLRSVSLKHDADGEPMLEIATTNPKVVILWFMDEGSKKDDE